MPTFHYKKLVRDNIPGWHQANGHTVKKRQLTDTELIKALIEKLHEEVNEIDNALSHEEIIEEIGDVEQVLRDICTVQNIDFQAVTQAMQKKTDRKGSYAGGEYIETITIPNEDDKWAKYCRDNPTKYPEISSSGHVDPDLPKLPNGTYKHTKSGKLYEVVGMTFHTETFEPLVIYKPLYESDYELFARPYAMFIEMVQLDGKMVARFEKISD